MSLNAFLKLDVRLRKESVLHELCCDGRTTCAKIEVVERLLKKF